MLLHGAKSRSSCNNEQRRSMQNVPMMMSFVLRIVSPDVPQLAIIPGGSRSEIGVEEGHDLEAAQAAFDARRMSFIAGSLKDFEQNEIADQDRFAAGRSFELRGRHGPGAAKVGDPDRAVNEDHDGARSAGPGASRRGRLPNPIP